MDERSLRELAARAVLAWLVLSALGWLFGGALLEVLLPALALTVNTLADGYSAALSMDDTGQGKTIHMVGLVTQPIRVSDALTVDPGARLTAGAHLIHALVPVVLLYIPLLAWPVVRPVDRVWLLAAGAPLAFAVLLMTVPFLLVSHIETMLAGYAVRDGAERLTPWYVYWSMFNESGGRWMIPVALAGVCISLRRGAK